MKAALKRMDGCLEGYRLISRGSAAACRAFNMPVETVALEVRSAASNPDWAHARRWAQWGSAREHRIYHRHRAPKARAGKRRRRQIARQSRRRNRGGR